MMRTTIITPTPTPVLKISPIISQPERMNKREISDAAMIDLFSIYFRWILVIVIHVSWERAVA